MGNPKEPPSRKGGVCEKGPFLAACPKCPCQRWGGVGKGPPPPTFISPPPLRFAASSVDKYVQRINRVRPRSKKGDVHGIRLRTLIGVYPSSQLFHFPDPCSDLQAALVVGA